jgi:subtilisin family serine protease
MSKHVVLICALVGSGLVALGCAGSGTETPSGDGAPPVTDGGEKDGKADSKRLRVGKNRIERKSGRPEKQPTGALMEKSRKKEEFLVKLAPGVKELQVGDKVRTGKSDLDGAFGELNLKGANKIHEGGGARKRDVAETLGLSRTIRIRSAKDPEEVIRRLEAHPDVEWVEPVSEVKGAAVPNDPYFKYQWHLQALNATKAWEITQGEGVVVAVIDTGVSVKEDGFFKLLKGKDFVDGDSDPQDENGHGTHVAGTIGQASNNGVGVAGVAPKVSILPVRVLDANGSGDNTAVAQGIIWAVDNGANIINLSLGSPMNSETVADAVAYAYENDVTVVAATGNDGFTDFIGYPAALETTIAVGATDVKNVVTFYSNQGRQIDLVAPGGDTTADQNGDGQQDGVLQETRLNGEWAYHWLQGTSMATPHVAGVAALVYANGVRDPDALREVLTSTASDLGDKGWDTVYGHGLVNPVAALGQRAPREARNGKNPQGGGDKLVISRTRVKKAGNTRAVIGWMTSEPARTMVRGSNGFERKDDTMTKVHQVAVQGKPGSTVEFTIGSATSKENKARDTITVTF